MNVMFGNSKITQTTNKNVSNSLCIPVLPDLIHGEQNVCYIQKWRGDHTHTHTHTHYQTETFKREPEILYRTKKENIIMYHYFTYPTCCNIRVSEDPTTKRTC